MDGSADDYSGWTFRHDVTGLLARYHNGEVTFDELKDAIATYPFQAHPSLDMPTGHGVAGGIYFVTDAAEAIPYPAPGTLEEIDAAVQRGLLSAAEAAELEAVAHAAGYSHPPKPTSDPDVFVAELAQWAARHGYLYP